MTRAMLRWARIVKENQEKHGRGVDVESMIVIGKQEFHTTIHLVNSNKGNKRWQRYFGGWSVAGIVSARVIDTQNGYPVVVGNIKHKSWQALYGVIEKWITGITITY